MHFLRSMTLNCNFRWEFKIHQRTRNFKNFKLFQIFFLSINFSYFAGLISSQLLFKSFFTLGATNINWNIFPPSNAFLLYRKVFSPLIAREEQKCAQCFAMFSRRITERNFCNCFSVHQEDFEWLDVTYVNFI